MAAGAVAGAVVPGSILVCAVAAEVASVVAAAVAPGSTLVCAAVATGAFVAAELAAMAAAAMASGAVALPDDDAAAGTIIGVTATGIATATGFGVVTAGPSCFTGAAGSAAVACEESPGEVSLEDGFAVDLVSVFEPPDFAFEPWAASALALALAFALASALALAFAWERWLSAASRLSERAAWSVAALSRDRLPSATADELSGRRCEAVCSGARSLPVSAAVLLSTSAAKLSFPGDGSVLAALGGGAPWKDVLVAASDVRLDTGGLIQCYCHNR